MNKVRHVLHYIFGLVLIISFFSSCKTSSVGGTRLYDPKEVAQLSRKLDIELSNINKDDDRNMSLYAEVSQWLGVPYRYGGITRRGLDCSGFTYLIFQKVYGKILPRSTSDLANMKMHHVSKGSLRAGDLVFFATTKSKKKITHVGIYLKNGQFIHASTSRGVIVSHLDEDYYQKRWKKGGRIK